MSKAEAVRTFGVSKIALFGWLKQVKASGERALAARKRGRPKESKLKGHQAATIVRMITDRCPEQLNMHQPLDPPGHSIRPLSPYIARNSIAAHARYFAIDTDFTSVGGLVVPNS